MSAARIAADTAQTANCGGLFAGHVCVHPALLVLVATALTAAVCWFVLTKRSAARRRALTALLDAADGLERRLRDARAALPPAPDAQQDPIRSALQEVLRQRLWLQQHGDRAAIMQINSVRDGLLAARQRIDAELRQIRATAPPPTR